MFGFYSIKDYKKNLKIKKNPSNKTATFINSYRLDFAILNLLFLFYFLISTQLKTCIAFFLSLIIRQALYHLQRLSEVD